jgi:hypothetical protein
MKDYSMYKYYKGSDEYPNRKAAFCGFYESCFEKTYKGKPEDKEESFKDYMSTLLYEKLSDACNFGYPGVNVSEKLEEGFREYFEPDYHLEHWERD